MANSSDFDICSILFARAVPEGDFIYASEILSTCKPSSIFEGSMLKNNYAVLAIEEKNYSKGLAYLREAQKIQRCNYLSDKNLFEYYMFTKEYHKATGVALKRLTDCEDQVDHWAHVLYLLYPEQNGYQNIIDVLKKIAASNPSDGNIQFYLGEAYRREKKYEEAIVYYENSSQLGTLFIREALAEVSNIFRTRGEYIESEKYAKQLIDLDNESFLGHYHMAYAQFMQKEYEEAVRHYETALKIQPNHFAVLYELGEVYSLGEIDRADNYRQLAKTHWPIGYGPPKELLTPK